MFAELKIKAREALKGHWLTALLIALTVNLPTLLVEAITSFTGNDLMTRLTGIAASRIYAGSLTQASLDGLRTEAAAVLREPGIRWALAFSLLARLLTPALALSMFAWMIGRLRGLEDNGPAAGAFCRIRYFIRAICQKILTVLKVVLWMLPGLALCMCGTFLLTVIPRDGSTPRLLAAAAQLPALLGYGLMAALGIRAALHYSLADMVLADRPQNGALKSIRQSTAYMKNRKMQLFLLCLSFIGWDIAVMIAASLAGNIAGNVAFLAVQMFGSLALTVYMNTSIAAFYEDCRKTDEPHMTHDADESDREDESL